VGDTLRIGPAPDSLHARAVVAAIYEPKPDPAGVLRPDRYVRLHLPDLAALLGTPDRVDRFGIALVPGTDPSRAADTVNRTAFGFRAFPSRTIAAESSQTFLVVSRFHRAIEACLIAGLGSVLGSALAVVAGAVTNAYYQRLFDTGLVFSLVTPGIVGFSVALSLCLGLGAGALAAWRLVRTSPTVLWGRG
jgi:putative ABC transport system permease protein